MKMKTYQADTMQEALAMVKEEMGPDAVILKSRRTTRKVSGKTHACFEVTAAEEESLAARASRSAAPSSTATARPSATSRAPVTAELPEPMPAEAREQATARPAAAARANAPLARAGRLPAESDRGTYDWKGSLRRVTEQGAPVGANGSDEAATSSAGTASTAANGFPAAGNALPTSGSLIELLRSELREMKDRVDMPTREIKVLKDEIKALFAARNTPVTQAPAQPVNNPPTQIGFAPSSAYAPASSHALPTHPSVPPEFQGLHESLLEMEIEPDLAAELARAAAADGRYAFWRNGPEAEERGMGILARCMAERIRTTGGIRLRPGRPTTVALVGPTGVGKTTTLAKLAAIAKMQQNKKVGIISADSFRMGANEQLELFGRTAGIPVRPVFSPEDVAQAQREFAKFDLVLVDTAGRSHTHLEMWRELQGLLHALHPDEIHLVLSGPTRMRELKHQYTLYRDLGAGSIIFTKLDECLSLGCLYNLARRVEAPLSYLCNGQVIPDHIMLAGPESVATAVMGSIRALASVAERALQPRPHEGPTRSEPMRHDSIQTSARGGRAVVSVPSLSAMAR